MTWKEELLIGGGRQSEKWSITENDLKRGEKGKKEMSQYNSKGKSYEL